jgi:hypothetical protein
MTTMSLFLNLALSQTIIGYSKALQLENQSRSIDIALQSAR